MMKGEAQKVALVAGSTDRPARANAQAHDPQVRRRLAQVSAGLAGLDPEP